MGDGVVVATVMLVAPAAPTVTVMLDELGLKLLSPK
jgi:hypothetical protein